MSVRETFGRWRARRDDDRPGRLQSTPAASQEAAGSAMPEALRAAMGSTRVVVLTRQGCHLCDAAVEVVQRVAPQAWCARDVDADDELRARYTDHVPVTFVDGQLVAYWTLDEHLLREALAGRPGRPPAL